MNSVWRNLPGYMHIAALWPQVALVYRLYIVMNMIGVVLRIFLITVVFRAVYAGRPSVDGIALPEVITFITLAELQGMLVVSMLPGHLGERIREGSIIFDLGRPAPFLGQLMAHQIGNTLSALPFLVLVLPFALLVGGIQPPASAGAGLLYLLSLGLGYIIAVQIGMLIGLVAFWTTRIGGFMMIYYFVNHFFSGALVPLWFFPPVLRRVAALLPFQTQTFIPISIYGGQIAGSAVVGALGLQVFWIAVLGVLAWLVWRRAMLRVTVHGG